MFVAALGELVEITGDIRDQLVEIRDLLAGFTLMVQGSFSGKKIARLVNAFGIFGIQRSEGR